MLVPYVLPWFPMLSPIILPCFSSCPPPGSLISALVVYALSLVSSVSPRWILFEAVGPQGIVKYLSKYVVILGIDDTVLG